MTKGLFKLKSTNFGTNGKGCYKITLDEDGVIIYDYILKKSKKYSYDQINKAICKPISKIKYNDFWGIKWYSSDVCLTIYYTQRGIKNYYYEFAAYNPIKAYILCKRIKKRISPRKN